MWNELNRPGIAGDSIPLENTVMGMETRFSPDVQELAGCLLGVPR